MNKTFKIEYMDIDNSRWVHSPLRFEEEDEACDSANNSLKDKNSKYVIARVLPSDDEMNCRWDRNLGNIHFTKRIRS